MLKNNNNVRSPVCPIVGCFMVQAQHYHLVKMLNECKSFMISKEQLLFFFFQKGFMVYCLPQKKEKFTRNMFKSYFEPLES